MNAIPDLAVEFEAENGYTISPPPPALLSTPPSKRDVPGDESPPLTPPLKSSESSNTTLSEQEIKRTSTRRSRKSLPSPVTDNADRRRVGAPLSFFYGLVLGVLPFLIVARFLIHRFRGTDDTPKLQERWFKYGRSIGLLLFVAIVIVVLVQLT